MHTRGTQLTVGLLAGLFCIGILMWMNSDYAQISDRSSDYALALISACGRQDEVRVQQIVKQVAEDELPDYDRRVILHITQVALNGDWESASSKARELLKSQIRPAQ